MLQRLRKQKKKIIILMALAFTLLMAIKGSSIMAKYNSVSPEERKEMTFTLGNTEKSVKGVSNAIMPLAYVEGEVVLQDELDLTAAGGKGAVKLYWHNFVDSMRLYI